MYVYYDKHYFVVLLHDIVYIVVLHYIWFDITIMTKTFALIKCVQWLYGGELADVRVLRGFALWMTGKRGIM